MTHSFVAPSVSTVVTVTGQSQCQSLGCCTFLHSAHSFACGNAHYQNFTNESKRRQREKKKENANVDVVVVQLVHIKDNFNLSCDSTFTASLGIQCNARFDLANMHRKELAVMLVVMLMMQAKDRV